MISTNFRIGNLLRDRLTGELLRISELTEEGIIFSVVDRSKFPLPDGWQAEPILLTPGILDAYGVKNNWLSLPNGDSMNISDGEVYIFAPDSATIGQAAGSIPCQYLHQLCNLYFALTGTELNYTP